MKKIVFGFLIASLGVFSFVKTDAIQAETTAFDSFLKNFNYETRKDMKIKSPQLIEALMRNKVQFIDIRFKEENQAWSFSFAKNIPLNELPYRLAELDKNKIIVTACPHKDRAGIAMAFLRTKGYKAKYLEDGLVGLAEYLRGDKAKEFIKKR